MFRQILAALIIRTKYQMILSRSVYHLTPMIRDFIVLTCYNLDIICIDVIDGTVVSEPSFREYQFK
jgi:hypothetical protein